MSENNAEIKQLLYKLTDEYTTFCQVLGDLGEDVNDAVNINGLYEEIESNEDYFLLQLINIDFAMLSYGQALQTRAEDLELPLSSGEKSYQSLFLMANF